MKKIVYFILLLTVLFQISIKPVKSFSNNDLLGVKYTIWDDEYEEKDTMTKILYYSISFVVVGTIAFFTMYGIKKAMGDTKPANNKPSAIFAVEDVASEKVYTYLNNENISSIKEKLFLRFVDYKTSYMNHAYDNLKKICETNFYNNTINQINTMIANHYVAVSHTFVSKNIKIGDIHEEGNLIVIDLYLLVNYFDYVEDQEKNVVAGRKLEPVDYTYKIEYVITKNKDNITCLNCGKRVYLENDGQCPYCGTPVKVEAKDYVIRNITNC